MDKEQQTLVFVKPGHIIIGSDVFCYLNSELEIGFGYKMHGHVFPSWNQMDEFYSHTRGMPFHNATIERYVNEGVLVRRYFGENIIKKVRDIVGNTDPIVAKPETIRGKFGEDSLKIAFKEGRFLENVFHASESREDYFREAGILLSL